MSLIEQITRFVTNSRDHGRKQRNKALESRIKQLAAQKFGKDAITKKLVSEYGYYQVMDFLRDNHGILVYLLLQEYSKEIK